MNDFLTSISGGYSLGQLLAFTLFFFIGLAAFSLQETSERNIESNSTPRRFSLSFFFRDNAKRFLLAVILIYIQFRFYKDITGNELNEFNALLMGYTGTGISGLVKRNNKALQANRDKLLKLYR